MERKQIIIIGSVIGGIVVIGLVVLVVFLRLRATADLQPIVTTNTPSGPAVQVPVGTGQMDASKQQMAEQEKERLAAKPKDTDGDGLSDDDETKLGTNINDADTDHDGSNDWEEVTTLKTDPLKPNTDTLDKRVADVNQRLSTVSSTRPTPAPSTSPTPSPATPSSSPDADGDGLTAEQEVNVGTDPNNSDTDGDGLSDRQEVETYKTDPLRADTDNDTFSVGGEVQAGYNPLGPGKCARTTCIP